MKRNKLFLLGLFVVFAAVLSLSLVSSTFARYVSDGSATDTARVAKWGVAITAEAFADDQLEADLTTTEDSIVTIAESELLAPGTGIHFASVAISGTPEVAVRVTYEANLELNGWTYGTGEYMPLVFVINGTDEYSMSGLGSASVDAFEAKIEELIAAYSKEYAAGEDLAAQFAEELTVSCYWDIDTGHDVEDTHLGNLAANGAAPTVTLTITATVTQID